MCPILGQEILRKIVFSILITIPLTLGNSEQQAGEISIENIEFAYCNNPVIRRMLSIPLPIEVKEGVSVILKRNYSAITSGILFCNDDKDILYSYRYESQKYMHNITGHLIRVGAILGYDHDTSHTYENGSLRLTGGLYFHCLNYLTDSLNLSVIAIDGVEFAATKPKNRIDIGSMIISGEVDLAISVHEYTSYRASKFSYLQPNYMEKLWGYFIQPPASSIRDIYHQAFQMDIWIVMAFTWIIIILSVILVSCSKKLISDLHHNDKMILDEVVIWAVGAICQLGGHLNPESVSLKIVYFCGLATGVVTYLGYSAALFSVLSLEVVPLKTLSDMIFAKFQFYGSDAIPNVQYYLGKIEEDHPSLVNQRSLAGTIVGINEILHGGSAFLSFDDEFFPSVKVIPGLSNVFICSTISKILVNHTPIKASMLVKKGSPYKEGFNRKLIWMINNGILSRLRKQHIKLTKISCLKNSHHRNAALGTNDIFTAIAILLVIYSFSLLFFIIEKSISQRPP